MSKIRSFLQFFQLRTAIIPDQNRGNQETSWSLGLGGILAGRSDPWVLEMKKDYPSDYIWLNQKSALWYGLTKIRIHIHVCSVKLFYHYKKPIPRHDILDSPVTHLLRFHLYYLTITHCDAHILTYQRYFGTKFWQNHQF